MLLPREQDFFVNLMVVIRKVCQHEIGLIMGMDQMSYYVNSICIGNSVEMPES